MATRPTKTKPTTALKAVASVVATAPVADADVSTGATTPKPESGPMLKKKDFIDRAVAKSGIKKKDARPAIEAALAVLAEALIAGEEPNLPPLGKMRVTRDKDVSGGKMLVVRLRINDDKPKVSGSTPLAEDDADS